MQGNNNPPRVNWQHHANAVEGSSSKDDFLSSSFLFSLPTQRPGPEANREGVLSLRYALICAMHIGYILWQINKEAIVSTFQVFCL
jgi:hypothetical protein